MSLQNFQVRRNCHCNDSKDTVAKLRGFEQGDFGFIDLDMQEILFIIKGAVGISIGRQSALTMNEGEFIYLPTGTRMHYEARKESVIFTVRIQGNVPECHVLQGDRIADIEYYEEIYPMKLNENMRRAISNLLEILGDGLRCRQFLQMEASRISYLVHAYYPQEECLKFFSQRFSPDVKFQEFVRVNWMKYGNVKGLAEGLCMTSQQFSNRFRKIFGMPPHAWITQQKAQRIYQDICHSSLSLKEIALKYDFNTQANFFHFCKHVFGDTPGRIRKSLKCDGGAA